ncbi:hypothetical protein BX265_3706 [Streptomyces sp. TLI_235]|nr:DUF3592 domain-containing protein [Streptomyces sp. TLI_235]PBC78915.1 hypothetical protein BX265_3706 [Streptomyces sp. TLI_235]
METPTAVAAGAVLTFFGSALLLWCAAELRLRHHLRRHGIPATARVVADGDPYGELYGDTFGELDSAPLLSYTALPEVEVLPVSGAEAGRARPVRAAETVLARPRGSTPLRRPSRLVPGAMVQVMYDARRPSRVVLAGTDMLPTLATDVFWAVLGTGALAGGLSLFASLLAD